MATESAPAVLGVSQVDPAAGAGRAPPGPTTLQVVQSFNKLRADPLAYMTRMSRDYGAVSRVPIGNERLVFVSEPELIGEVLQKLADNFITVAARGEGSRT